MMPVKKDPSGRRYVQAEVEVPGTPEEVWQAIATGPGISSWFVPTEVMQGADGVPETLVMHFGPGNSMDARATVTAWQPPHRFAADSNDMAPNAPTVATEWIVESRSGGTCVVRVVHSWFADSDQWDNQFEGQEHGWVAFFRILRLYLEHFNGQPCATLQLMAITPDPAPAVWTRFVEPLGLSAAAEGQQVESGGADANTPRLAGRVERVGPAAHPELLLKLDEPAPGIAHFFVMPMGGATVLPIRLFFFGTGAAATRDREEAAWHAWTAAHFPSASGSTPAHEARA
jgi:uncharacterized protein YndB with AHSA1/START domain